MRTIKNESQKIGVLRSCGMNSGKLVDLHDHIRQESESDPHYYRWLFDDNSISDFGRNLTSEDWSEIKRFLDLVPVYVHKMEQCWR